MEYEDSVSFPVKEEIGIDLGIKELAICSDEKTYQNINKTQKVKRPSIFTFVSVNLIFILSW